MPKICLKSAWQGMTAAEKVEFAERVDTSVAYLSQVCNGLAAPGKFLKRVMEQELPGGEGSVRWPAVVDVRDKGRPGRKPAKARAA